MTEAGTQFERFAIEYGLICLMSLLITAAFHLLFRPARPRRRPSSRP